jgi:hypothetical protein
MRTGDLRLASQKSPVLMVLLLHQAKLLTLELIPLGPLAPLYLLLDENHSKTTS